jgi:hypothetical protein
MLFRVSVAFNILHALGCFLAAARWSCRRLRQRRGRGDRQPDHPRAVLRRGTGRASAMAYGDAHDQAAFEPVFPLDKPV